MSASSSIEWTDATWTPIRARCWEIQDDGSGKERLGWHCEHVSEGCRNCYAERINLRLGTGHHFKPGSLRGKPGYHGGGNDRPELFLDEKMLLAPLRWKKPRMVFVCSMTDLFASFVTDEWIDRVFAVMALSPQHTYQVLTKRPERMRAWFANALLEGKFPTERKNNVSYQAGEFAAGGIASWRAAEKAAVAIEDTWPLPNVWLGTSVEDQATADERIPHLLQTPAAVRFVSYEPALGPVRFNPCRHCNQPGNIVEWPCSHCKGRRFEIPDWVICGGESGSNARPMHPDWARSARDQCAETGAAFFFKQWGAHASIYDRDVEDPDWRRCDVVERGTPQGQWLNLAGGMGFHGARVVRMDRVGKKAAGRLLDGAEHNGFPETQLRVAA